MNKKDVLIVVCLHGNEPFGLEVQKELEHEFDFLIGNPEALKKKVRFLETDLNRSFPGSEEGSIEEKRAIEIVQIAKKYTLIIDLHSTTSETELFAITTQLTDEIKNLTQQMNIPKLVHISAEIGKNKSLLDHVPLGISLEVGPHDRKENAKETVEAIRSLFKATTENKDLEIFEVFDTVKGTGTPDITNFKEVKKGERVSNETAAPYNFYPIMAGEASYKGVLSLAARKI
jgi:succinylglutamate desuccinylase